MTDAVDFQMQLAKSAQFRRPFFRSTTRILTNTPQCKLPHPPNSCQLISFNYSYSLKKKRRNLPRHLVGLVTLPQAEGAGEVAGQQIHLLDAGKQSLVDSLLVSSTAAVDLLLL